MTYHHGRCISLLKMRWFRSYVRFLYSEFYGNWCDFRYENEMENVNLMAFWGQIRPPKRHSSASSIDNLRPLPQRFYGHVDSLFMVFSKDVGFCQRRKFLYWWLPGCQMDSVAVGRTNSCLATRQMKLYLWDKSQWLIATLPNVTPKGSLVW